MAGEQYMCAMIYDVECPICRSHRFGENGNMLFCHDCGAQIPKEITVEIFTDQEGFEIKDNVLLSYTDKT